MIYFFFTIGLQFWEPPRSALHHSNLDFLSLTPLLYTLMTSQKITLYDFPISPPLRFSVLYSTLNRREGVNGKSKCTPVN